MAAIVADRLSKAFTLRIRPKGRFSTLRGLFRPERRIVQAVKGASFSVNEGEVVAFLGPNGAGKSTTIKMLTGQLTPKAGAARILGVDVALDDPTVQAQIGVCFEEKNLYL
ncbi:MAG TPA: hypothetical protein DCG47_00050, partial [Spirochaetaceae bacterium]|nr:hypothetical protein [Spirochaetaceae bacterium]